MKKQLILWVALLFSSYTFGQTIDEIKADATLLWGYAEASSLQKADKAALDDLVSQISVQVASKFESMVSESDGNVKSFAKNVINTYSSTSLSAALRKVVEEPTGVKVIRYIPKSNLSEIFLQREKRMRDYLQTAFEAEKQYRIADALNNYYWALLLLRSHPDNQTLRGVVGEGMPTTLISAIPDRIRHLFANIAIEVHSAPFDAHEKVRMVRLNVNFKGQPIQNFDFTYWVGDSWSGQQSGRDGTGIVPLFNSAAELQKDVRLRFEYIFQQKAQIDKEILSITEDLDLPIFKECEFIVALAAQPVANPSEINTAISNTTATKTMAVSQVANSIANAQAKSTAPLAVGVEQPKPYAESVQSVVNAINAHKTETVRSHFTAEGWDIYNRIIAYGKARVVDVPAELRVIKVGNEIEVRDVTMHFSFPNNNRKFVEKVVFTFDTTGLITGLNFALSQVALNDIMNKDARFASPQEKYFIINMLENYKTAYCLKRIDYIESLFTDDALIIIGKKVEKDNSITDNMIPKFINNNDFVFVRKSKGEYINSLRNVFRSSEFVNINFEDNQIKRAREDEKIFGIQISQYYTAQSYADKGYLFLLVDLKDTLNPKIYVRSWQPEKSNDGSVIGLKDFSF